MSKAPIKLELACDATQALRVAREMSEAMNKVAAQMQRVGEAMGRAFSEGFVRAFGSRKPRIDQVVTMDDGVTRRVVIY